MLVCYRVSYKVVFLTVRLSRVQAHPMSEPYIGWINVRTTSNSLTCYKGSEENWAVTRYRRVPQDKLNFFWPIVNRWSAESQYPKRDRSRGIKVDVHSCNKCTDSESRVHIDDGSALVRLVLFSNDVFSRDGNNQTTPLLPFLRGK